MQKGIESLQAAVKRDCEQYGGNFSPGGCSHTIHKDDRNKAQTECGANCCHRYCDKYIWVIDRAKQYAEKTGMTMEKIIEGWETDRTYWYMNYYQDCNQPACADGGDLRFFETLEEFLASIEKDKGFRCPACEGISKNPYKCTCEKCDWAAYGLLGTMGKGISVFVKEKNRMDHIFMPIAWESERIKEA